MILRLDRRVALGDDGQAAASVVVEDGLRLGVGWLARLSIDPADPHGWHREHLRATRKRWTDEGRPAIEYRDLEPGTYQATSVWTGGRPLVMFFAVGEAGRIRILARQGEHGCHETVMAALRAEAEPITL